jgi:hypothetical protein
LHCPSIQLISQTTVSNQVIDAPQAIETQDIPKMTDTEDDAPSANGDTVDPPKLIRRKSDADEPLTALLPPRLKSKTTEEGASAAEPTDGGTESIFPPSSTNSVPIPPTMDATGSVVSSEIVSSLHNPDINDQSPAAESLRASAEVHVGTTAKLARKMHVEKIRKVIKKATQRGIGNRRGKPPRIPPNRGSEQEEEGIYVVEEGDEEYSDSDDDSDDEEGHSRSRSKDSDDVGVEDQKKHVAFVVEHEKHHKVPAEVLTATLETGKKCK